MTAYDHLTDDELIREAQGAEGLLAALRERLEIRTDASVFRDIAATARLSPVTEETAHALLTLFLQRGPNALGYFFDLLEVTTMTALSLGDDLDQEWDYRLRRKVAHHSQQELF